MIHMKTHRGDHKDKRDLSQFRCIENEKLLWKWLMVLFVGILS